MTPVLLTARLRLDGHRADDLDALAALWADHRIYAMIGGRSRSREETWLRLLRSVGQWTLMGYGSWAVRDRASGVLLGEAGLLEAHRAIEPALDAPEMGWVLAADAQGRGLASEAMAAALRWADDHGIARTLCIIDPANAASIRLSARLGYRAVDRRTYRETPIDLFERDAPPR